MIAWSGFSRALLPYRAAGESKYTLVKMVALALDAIVSFSIEEACKLLSRKAGFPDESP